ncbi:MAG: hypothetical protein LBB81_08840 [Treponema sp.]|jgi:hypothetical protein|nr:hypothetical protein [Treponema sp.]
MKLIDTVYIHTGGGAVLLDLIINNFGQQDDLYFLFDIRYSPKQIPKNYMFIKGKEIERLKFFCKNKNNLSSVFCFGNVPPPIRLKVPVTNYFHNAIIIDTDEQVLTKKSKYCYIGLKNNTSNFSNHIKVYLLYKQKNLPGLYPSI